MSRDFWADMSEAYVVESAIDTHLKGRKLTDDGPMRALTDAGRSKAGLQLPVRAGTRVSFIANLGSVLTYADCPEPDMAGTVVTLRTAEGHATGDERRAFVLFDDDRLRAIEAEHLRLVPGKVAKGFQRVCSGLGDLTGFFSVNANRSDELVHKATKDLWSFKRDGDQYVIARLFNDEGRPLKV